MRPDFLDPSVWRYVRQARPPGNTGRLAQGISPLPRIERGRHHAGSFAAMLRRLFGVSLLGGLLVIVPAPDAQAQKKPDGKKPLDKPADAEKLTGGEFVGILKSTPGSDRMFTVEVEKKT